LYRKGVCFCGYLEIIQGSYFPKSHGFSLPLTVGKGGLNFL